MKIIKWVILLISFVVNLHVFADDENYFYCGFSNLDGSGQNFAKWGKGTDFKYNNSKDRWEWLSEYSNQYIFPDGRYEQVALVSYFENQKGLCNEKMEKIYKQKLKDLGIGS